MTLPRLPTLSDLAIRISTNPISKNIGEYLPISKAIIWLLTVVPMLAPKTMPIACLKVSTFELTKTMVMMIKADEEPSRVVATIPTSRLLNILEVNFLIHFEALSPSAKRSVSDRLMTAKRNRTKPAVMDRSISVIVSL